MRMSRNRSSKEGLDTVVGQDAGPTSSPRSLDVSPSQVDLL